MAVNTSEPEEPPQAGTRYDLRERRALVRQAMRFCLPEEMSIQLPGLGLFVLRPQVLEIEASPAWMADVCPSCEALSMECSDSAALLLIDRGAALNVVNAVLGYEVAAAAAPLSRIERGILQGALAALSVHLGLPPGVHLRTDGDQAALLDPITLEVSWRLRGGIGRAWVCASEEFLVKILTLKTPDRTPGQATVQVELACTRVPVSELAEAKEGDAVVFDGASAWLATEPWPVQIRRGKTVLPASLRPDGTLAIAGEDCYAACGSATKDERPAWRSSSDSAIGAAGKALCAEVTAEIGRLRGVALAEELLRTHASEGTPVLDRSDPILLRVDGIPWAEGEKIAIEGGLTVRITRRLAG